MLSFLGSFFGLRVILCLWLSYFKVDLSKFLVNFGPNGLLMLESIDLHVSHIFRKGNQVADVLSKVSILAYLDQWWHWLPRFFLDAHRNDVNELGSFRFFK